MMQEVYNITISVSEANRVVICNPLSKRNETKQKNGNQLSNLNTIKVSFKRVDHFKLYSGTCVVVQNNLIHQAKLI